MSRSYATHSASVCFNGGVKVKRQPWNILSLTSLQLILCNLHVIVWQRGKKTVCQTMLFYNVRYSESSQLVSLIMMLEHSILMPYCCVLFLNHPTNETRTLSVLSECDWIWFSFDMKRKTHPIRMSKSWPLKLFHLLIRHQLPCSDTLPTTLHSLPQFSHQTALDLVSYYTKWLCMWVWGFTFMRHSFSIKPILVVSA